MSYNKENLMNHNFEVGKKYKSHSTRGIISHECIFKDTEGVVIRRTYPGNETTCAWWDNKQAGFLWDKVKEIEPEIVGQAYWARLRSTGRILYSSWENPPDPSYWEILSGPHEVRYQPE